MNEAEYRLWKLQRDLREAIDHRHIVKRDFAIDLLTEEKTKQLLANVDKEIAEIRGLLGRA